MTQPEYDGCGDADCGRSRYGRNGRIGVWMRRQSLRASKQAFDLMALFVEDGVQGGSRFCELALEGMQAVMRLWRRAARNQSAS